MVASKYESLCIAVDKLESIKEYTIRTFTERFSEFMKSPQEYVTLNILETTVNNESVDFKCRLCVEIRGTNSSATVCIDGIELRHQQTESIHFISVSYNKVLSNLDQDPINAFNSLYTELTNSIK